MIRTAQSRKVSGGLESLPYSALTEMVQLIRFFAVAKWALPW